jgi:hypothetical protein
MQFTRFLAEASYTINGESGEISDGTFIILYIGTAIMMLAATFVFFVLPIWLIIRAVRRYRKTLDTDGDGLPGDGLPATAEQKRLIQAGFRNLGIHHEPPKKRMTQAQAREILREIDRKLHHDERR